MFDTLYQGEILWCLGIINSHPSNQCWDQKIGSTKQGVVNLWIRTKNLWARNQLERISPMHFTSLPIRLTKRATARLSTCYLERLSTKPTSAVTLSPPCHRTCPMDQHIEAVAEIPMAVRSEVGRPAAIGRGQMEMLLVVARWTGGGQTAGGAPKHQ